MNLVEFVNKAQSIPFKNRGRDYDGWDCWGLIVVAYRDCWDIDLKDFEYHNAMTAEDVTDHFDQYSKQWIDVKPNEVEAGDVVIIRYGKWPCHAAMVVKPGLMLHIKMDIDTCVESYSRSEWKHRIIGFYRHRDMVKRCS